MCNAYIVYIKYIFLESIVIINVNYILFNKINLIIFVIRCID